uniref:RING-type domain-containing protein n=1 Tax=Erythrolobus madagascarensis TaxID=708628 RepID=A0A7S0XIB6_9RHOD|mmetsp:Transcript_1355/g.2756  ORF Transcript_1355/g.2756 Transcript_1355/m.2756 type:complete len:555 (+) Transcript_1355:244-1908(+)
MSGIRDSAPSRFGEASLVVDLEDSPLPTPSRLQPPQPVQSVIVPSAPDDPRNNTRRPPHPLQSTAAAETASGGGGSIEISIAPLDTTGPDSRGSNLSGSAHESRIFAPENDSGSSSALAATRWRPLPPRWRSHTRAPAAPPPTESSEGAMPIRDGAAAAVAARDSNAGSTHNAHQVRRNRGGGLDADPEDSARSGSSEESDSSSDGVLFRLGRFPVRFGGATEFSWTMLLPLLSIAYFVTSSVATVSVLAVDWSRPCDEPLQAWLCVNLVVALVYVALKHVSKLDEVDELTSPALWRLVAGGFFRVIKWTSLVWFYLGLFWIVSSHTCAATAPSVYYLSLTLVVINLVLVVLSLCMTCCLCSIAARSAVEEQFRQAMNASSRPMSKDEISTVPEITFEHGMYKAEDCVCAICLCDYEPGEKLRTLPCNHHFHTPCIDRWASIDRSCPMCKQDITSASPAVAAGGDAAPFEDASGGGGMGTRAAEDGLESRGDAAVAVSSAVGSSVSLLENGRAESGESSRQRVRNAMAPAASVGSGELVRDVENGVVPATANPT